MAIQIGKYKRPGIFLEEFDNSVISSPIVTGLTNTVIGVSKKGPVNTPILLQNTGDLDTIFGSLDRQLERKGSFFHRTISKMLEASPVYAINLLLTDDTLDQIEYQSLSCATTVQNDIERLAPYRRFFDTTGFWKRDTDSFLNVTKDATYGGPGYEKRLLNFTNLSDKYVTIFVFKSQKSGFDRSLLEWYGSIEKMPPYVYPSDLASDYMVDVVIIGGDYSDYKSLSVDPRFSTYFSNSGLRKSQVRNFANDRNINTMAYLEGLSLIPYFKDLNGQNIFIETVINRNTDKHGVFCAFNADLFETDYPKGLVDLIGNNLVGDDLTANPPTADETYYGSLDSNDGTGDADVNMNFLSYKETITESVAFTEKVLDRPGNVIALFSTQSVPSLVGGQQGHALNPQYAGIYGGFKEGYVTSVDRTWWFAEGNINDVYVSVDGAATSNSLSITYTTGPNGYAVMGGNFVSVVGTFSLGLSSSYYSTSLTATHSYKTAFILDTTGTVVMKKVNTPDLFPSPSNPLDLVLGYASFSCYAGSFITSSVTLHDVCLYNNSAYFGGDASFKPLTYGASGDFQYTDYTTSTFKVVFNDTNMSIATNDYERYRRLRYFRNLKNLLSSSAIKQGAFIVDPFGGTASEKVSGTYVTISDVKDINTQLRSFVLNSIIPAPTNTTTNIVVEDDYVDNYFVTNADIVSIASSGAPLIFYVKDDEVILGVEGVVTKSTPAVRTGMGVVGRFSNLYNKFYQGIISTEDVMYQKTNFSPVQAQFVSGESVSDLLAGYDYLVFRVNNLEQDYIGEYRTDIINANKSYFEAVEPTVLGAGYQFLLSGSLNSGAFKTLTDEGLSTTNDLNPLLDTTYGQSPNNAGGATNSGRAYMLYELSAGTYSFIDTASYSYYAYEIEQNVTNETVNVINLFAYSGDYDDKPLYLDMDIDSNLNMTLVFQDYTLQNQEYIKSLIGGDLAGLYANTNFYVKSFDSNYKETVEIVEPDNYTSVTNKVLVNGTRYATIKVGDYLEAYYDESLLEVDQMPKKLTRVLSKRVWSGDSSLTEITCDSQIKVHDFGLGNKQTFRYTKLDDYVTTYKAISLKGFRVRQDSLPDGTEEKQSAILDLVASGTPLFKAVTNKEAFDFRYLIDSFGLGLAERSKQQLVDICGERLDCFGILNMPSMKSFKNSSSPSFVNSEGTLQIEYVAAGGDPESNPAFLYSFGDGRGVSAVGYFTPYVTVNDNGRPVDVPPSAYVGLTYMRKHNSTLTSIVPWTIAAGVTNGRITNIAGIEHDFVPTDIDYLNQAQMNPIVFKRNRGYIIETENTGQTLYKSALSYIHVREVLIELERELSRMLLDFQWKFNTPEIRAEIKLRADVICETYVSKNGLYNYFNKCDDENNTSEIIDNQIGVLDTYVEPIKGMGIIVNNITILRTGAIQAGGFITS